MPKTEGFHILDVQSDAIREDKAKNTAVLQPQNVIRKKLADISNQPQNQRLLIQEMSWSIEMTTKEYISQLQKENMALVKMLEQRKKVIEHNGNEIDRLRVHLLKMHEQNQQLALSNNQMLLELNSSKDRLKMLQHELGCKNGLLKARKLDLEIEARTAPLGDTAAELIKSEEEMELSKEGLDDEKPHETRSNFQPNGEYPREQVETKDTTKNNRPFLRRQSARFKAAEDSFKANETIVSEEQGTATESTYVKQEGSSDSSGTEYESQQFGSSVLHRPSRSAAKKVKSYKEVPINVKMRRSE